MIQNSTIKLLSHASILIDACGRKILTDPWYFGTAFNDGWELSPIPLILNKGLTPNNSPLTTF